MRTRLLSAKRVRVYRALPRCDRDQQNRALVRELSERNTKQLTDDDGQSGIPCFGVVRLRKQNRPKKFRANVVRG